MVRLKNLVATAVLIFPIAKATFADDTSLLSDWSINLTENTSAERAYNEAGLLGLCQKLHSTKLTDRDKDERNILAMCYYAGISVAQDWNAAIAILESLARQSYPGAREKVLKIRGSMESGVRHSAVPSPSLAIPTVPPEVIEDPKAPEQTYVKNLQSKYSDRLIFHTRVAEQAVKAFDIDCGTKDGRYLPFINVLYARIASMDSKNLG